MKKDKYRLEGGRIALTGRSCPKCGAGIFMAEHKDRLHCGKCGYTEWKGQKPPTREEKMEKREGEKKPADVPKEEEGKQ